MEKMIDLMDLLDHEIMNLHSAEEQIIEALPDMINKASNSLLKDALTAHLKTTKDHLKRLHEIKVLFGEESEKDKPVIEKKGFFSRLFGGGSHKCKGIEGIINEGKKMMGEDMSSQVLDAAIIAAAQKIEHYEISGYGTARAFASELGFNEVYNKFTETLEEEYAADDNLTKLAVNKLNIKAEQTNDNDHSRRITGIIKDSAIKKKVSAAKKIPAKTATGNVRLKVAAKKTASKKTVSTAKKTERKKPVDEK